MDTVMINEIVNILPEIIRRIPPSSTDESSNQLANVPASDAIGPPATSNNR